jgi:Zn-dependent alcohol dehydrogenase
MAGTAVSDGTFRVQAKGQNVYPYALLGTFAPYVVVHQSSLVKIDPAIPFEIAALVSCGVTTGFGSATRAAEVRPGDGVVVVGIGGVGTAAVRIGSSPSTPSNGTAIRQSKSLPHMLIPTSTPHSRRSQKSLTAEWLAK